MIELIRNSSLRSRIDGSALRPSVLSNMSRDAILALPLPSETGAVPLADVFSMERKAGDDDCICIRGDCSHVDGIGRGLDRGVLLLDGNAGDHFGASQTGGMLVTSGNVGAFTCSAMRQGTVWIGGDCGDRLGAPFPGERSGIRGGDIIIVGKVGERACERMRRGTVCIGGDVGDYLAPHMIAGTILAMGRVGSRWGLGMRRGSLIFSNEPELDSAATWTPHRELELSFLPLVWNHLRSLQCRITEICNAMGGIQIASLALPSTRWVARSIGDLSVNGCAELLLLRRMTSIHSNETTVGTGALEGA